MSELGVVENVEVAIEISFVVVISHPSRPINPINPIFSKCVLFCPIFRHQVL